MRNYLLELCESNRKNWISELALYYGKEYGIGWKSCGYQDETHYKNHREQAEKQETESRCRRILLSES